MKPRDHACGFLATLLPGDRCLTERCCTQTMPHGSAASCPSTSIREPAMRTNPSGFDAPHAEPSLRTAEVARALGVSPRAIRTWADEGKIACYRTFGGHRLFTASEVRRVLASWSGGSGSCIDESG